MLERGYIQIYTGDGKGKTTASLGLAMRALGHGWKVLIIQFAKGDSATSYGEIVSGGMFPNLDIIQCGVDRVVYSHNVCLEDYKEAKKGWGIAKEAIQSNKYQLIILDEITTQLDIHTQEQILALLHELQCAQKLSYLFITHDRKALQALAHRVITLTAP